MHHSRLKSMGVLCFGGFLLCCFVFVNNSFAHSINRMATSVASAKSQRQLLQDTSLMPGIPIGIIFDKNTSSEIQDQVDRAIFKINNGIKYGRNKWSVKINVINMNNNLELERTICAQMSRGVLAIFGDLKRDSLETIISYTNHYQIPYLTWSFLNRVKEVRGQADFLRSKQRMKKNPMDSQMTSNQDQSTSDTSDISIRIQNKSSASGDESMPPFQIYLRPDISPILIEIIKYYEWTDVFYIYNYPQALVNLERLFEYQNKNTNFTSKILIRKIIDIYDCRDMLRAIENTNEKNMPLLSQVKINMIVDLDTRESFTLFLNQIKDLGMTKTRFHYVLATYGIYELDINDFRHGGANIIGFSLVDYHNINTIKLLSEIVQTGEALNRIAYIPNDVALLVDGLAYLSKRVNSVIGVNLSSMFGISGVSLRRAEIYVNKSRGINCSYSTNGSNIWPLGRYILDLLKSKQDNEIYDGLTGLLNFDNNGKRVNSTVWIYKVGLNMPLTKIGYYLPDKGVRLNERTTKNEDDQHDSKEQRKRIVVSIKDEPFFMVRPNEPGKNFTGNDRFYGFCVDLTKKLAEIVNFTYELRHVKDGRFGSRDANGNWDGIVGELVRNEADIAIAPLTISSARERAIEFSMPFMNMGISIMIKKPKKEKPGVFSFMAPLDSKIWVCVILAYVGVSVVLYLVSRFSPYEWYYDPTKNSHTLNNDFTVLNTLWFNLAALMQQGVDTAPKSISGRLVASVWWFFTLILISSYTANLAAFLTVEWMVSPIESADQLSKQTKIQYGTVDGGATQEFFKNSNDDTFSRMWKHMQSWGPSVFVKSNAEGVQKVRESKGQYAFLLESSLNEYLNERMPCDTIKVGSDLDSKGYGIATPFKSDLRDQINLAVLQLREDGYLEELKTTWWFDKGECGTTSSSAKDSSSRSALNLINVAGIFYILIIGLMLSVLVACLELMYKAKLQSEKTKIEFKEAVKSKMRLSISAYDESAYGKDSQQKLSDTNNPLIEPYLKDMK